MDTIRRDVLDAVVWLDLDACRRLLSALVRGDEAAAREAVERQLPELRGVIDVADPRWRDALLDELELRVAGHDDDPDQIATREVPNLARFALDRRDDE
jgi:hypothetical protein